MSDRARYWQRLVAAWQKSGLSQAEFCRRREISAVTFAWWKRRLRGGTKPRRRENRQEGRSNPHPQEGFVELALPPRALAFEATRPAAPPAFGLGAFGYEIALPSGRVLRLPHPFDPAVVAQLIRTVESC
jgi:hypothetical protein